MENTERIWILYNIVWSFKCLAAEEGGATAAKRQL